MKTLKQFIAESEEHKQFFAPTVMKHSVIVAKPVERKLPANLKKLCMIAYRAGPFGKVAAAGMTAAAATLTLHGCASFGADEIGQTAQVMNGGNIEVFNTPTNLVCPPGDRNDWYLVPGDGKTKQYTWVSNVNAADFNKTCNPMGYTFDNKAVAACIINHGNGTSTVYSRIPRAMLAKSIQDHELCHGQGWSHDTLGQMRGHIWNDK